MLLFLIQPGWAAPETLGDTEMLEGVLAMAALDDGGALAVVAPGPPGPTTLVHVDGARVRRTVALPRPVDVDADGPVVVVADDGGQVHLLDRALEVLDTVALPGVASVALAPEALWARAGQTLWRIPLEPGALGDPREVPCQAHGPVERIHEGVVVTCVTDEVQWTPEPEVHPRPDPVAGCHGLAVQRLAGGLERLGDCIVDPRDGQVLLRAGRLASDGTHVVGLQGGALIAWDPVGRAYRVPPAGHAAAVVDVVEVGAGRVASLDAAGVVVLWDAATGVALQRWTGVPATHLARWGDGGILFHGPGASGRVGEEGVSWTGPSGIVAGHGPHVARLADDGLFLHDPATGTVLHHLRLPAGATLRPDGIAAWQGLWDLSDPAQPRLAVWGRTDPPLERFVRRARGVVLRAPGPTPPAPGWFDAGATVAELSSGPLATEIAIHSPLAALVARVDPADPAARALADALGVPVAHLVAGVERAIAARSPARRRLTHLDGERPDGIPDRVEVPWPDPLLLHPSGAAFYDWNVRVEDLDDGGAVVVTRDVRVCRPCSEVLPYVVYPVNHHASPRPSTWRSRWRPGWVAVVAHGSEGEPLVIDDDLGATLPSPIPAPPMRREGPSLVLGRPTWTGDGVTLAPALVLPVPDDLESLRVRIAAAGPLDLTPPSGAPGRAELAVFHANGGADPRCPVRTAGGLALPGTRCEVELPAGAYTLGTPPAAIPFEVEAGATVRAALRPPPSGEVVARLQGAAAAWLGDDRIAANGSPVRVPAGTHELLCVGVAGAARRQLEVVAGERLDVACPSDARTGSR